MSSWAKPSFGNGPLLLPYIAIFTLKALKSLISFVVSFHQINETATKFADRAIGMRAIWQSAQVCLAKQRSRYWYFWIGQIMCPYRRYVTIPQVTILVRDRCKHPGGQDPVHKNPSPSICLLCSLLLLIFVWSWIDLNKDPTLGLDRASPANNCILFTLGGWSLHSYSLYPSL